MLNGRGQISHELWGAARFDPVSAAIGVGVLGAGAGLLGAKKQSDAVQSAANTEAQQQELARQQQNELIQQQRADLAPWRDTGTTANKSAADILGINGPDAATAAMADYHTSPGYQFALDQGLRAVDAGAAAKGLLRSGATLKAEQTFGEGLADQDFSNYYNRLFGLSQQGVTAATGGASTANAGIAGSTSLANTGAALAGSTGAQEASIYGNTATGISNQANALLNNPAVKDWLGSSGPSYDPSIYGYTAGGAGANTLQSLGFYNPLSR